MFQTTCVILNLFKGLIYVYRDYKFHIHYLFILNNTFFYVTPISYNLRNNEYFQ